MSSSRASTDRLQRQLVELLKLPGNNTCADCQARNARWASWNLGIFLCERCAGLHRRMGSHISKVKSLTHDTWSKEQVDSMKSRGNTVSNGYFNPDARRNPPPTTTDESDREGQLERFIRNKYEYRIFVDSAPTRSAQPASPTARTPTPAPVPAQPAQEAQPPPMASQASLAFLDALGPNGPYRPSTAPPPAHASHQIDTSYRSSSAAPAAKRVRFLPPEEIPDSEDEDKRPPKLPSRARPKRGILAPRSSRGQVWPGEGGNVYVPKPPVEWHEEDVVDNQGHLAPQPLTPQGTGWSQAPQAGWSAQGAYQQQQQQQQQQALSAGGMFGGLGGGSGAGGSLPPLTAQGTGFPRAGSPFAPQPQQPQQTGPSFMSPNNQPFTSAGSNLMPPAPAPLTHQLTGWTPRGPSPIPSTFEPGGSLSGSSFVNPTANGAPPIGVHNAPGTSNNAPQYGRGPSPGPFASLHLTPGGTPPPGQMHPHLQQNALQPQPLTAQGTGFPRTSSPNPFMFSQPTGDFRNASPGPFDPPPLPNRPSPSPLGQQQTGYQRQSSPFNPNQIQSQPTGYSGSSIGLGHPAGGMGGNQTRNTSNASTISTASFSSAASYNPFASAMGQTQQQSNGPPPLPARPGAQQPTKQPSSIWDDLSDLNTPQPHQTSHSNNSFQNDSPFDFGPTQSNGMGNTYANNFNPSTSQNGSFLSSQNGSFLGSSQHSTTSNSSFLSTTSTGRTPGKAFVPSSAFGQELAKDLSGGGGLGASVDAGGRFTPSPSMLTPTQSSQGVGGGGSYFGQAQPPSSGNGPGGVNPFFGMGSQLGGALPRVQPQPTGNPFNFGQQHQHQQQGMGGYGQNGFYGGQQAGQQQPAQNDNPFNFF